MMRLAAILRALPTARSAADDLLRAMRARDRSATGFLDAADFCAALAEAVPSLGTHGAAATLRALGLEASPAVDYPDFVLAMDALLRQQ